MRLVKHPEFYPGCCALTPGKRIDPVGFIDTGMTIPFGPRDPRIYISVDRLPDLLKAANLPLPKAHEEAMAELDKADKHIAELEAEVQSLQREVQAYETLTRKQNVKQGRNQGKQEDAD